MLTDYAFLFDTNKDTQTWQHAETNQMFRTVDLTTGNFGFYIFYFGTWVFQGIKTMPEIVQIASKVNQ